MSGSVTLASLISRARQRADAVNNEFFDDATDLASFANQSLAELYDILVQADEDYFTTNRTLALVPNVSTYSVAAWSPKMLKLRGVDIPWAGTTYNLTAARLEFGERNDLQGPVPAYTMGFPSRFYRYGDSLVFAPTPGASVTATVWYIPAPPTLAGATTFDCQSGWDEFIVADMVRKMLMKQERDAGAITQEREALRAHIIASYRRDFSGPKHVTRRRYRNQMYPYGRRFL